MSAGASKSRVFVTGLRGIPDVMGGVETHCHEIYTRITDRNPSLSLTILARSNYVGKKAYVYRDICVVPQPTISSVYFEAIASTFLSVVYAWRHKADILHIHALGPALLTPLARVLGMQVVVTHHGEDFAREKWGPISRFMLRLGERFALTFAHRVIAVSPSIASRLKLEYKQGCNKVEYIPNGAPDFRNHLGSPERVVNSLGLERNGFFLGVGRLVPEKEFHTLIDAFIKARQELPGMKLVIAGDTDFPSSYADHLRNRSDDTIIFLGKQKSPILAALYHCSRCFILPSSHEALAIVALEAVACGATIIASDIPANRNFALPNECYFPLGDADQLASLLKNVPVFPSQAQTAMLKAFNWDHSASQTLQVYMEIAVQTEAAESAISSAENSQFI